MNLHLSNSKLWIAAALALAGTLPGSAQSTNHSGARDFSAFQIISERNIFDPNRRPRIQQQRSTPRVQQVVDSFSLVGTMSYSNLLLAFFDGTSADYRKSLPVGGKIASYTATEITQNEVKLVSGTNEVALRVGMQMRRSEDGTWTATDAPANAFTSGGNQNSGSNDRRTDYGRSRFRGNSSYSSTPGSSGNETAPADTGNAQPVVPGNLDPNDPVARLMLRRMQEENGGVPPTPANNSAPGNPPGDNPPNFQNENPEPNTNGPEETNPIPNPNGNAQPERH